MPALTMYLTTVHELRIERLEQSVDQVFSLLPSSSSRQRPALSTSTDTEAPQDSETLSASSEQSLADGIRRIVSAHQADRLVADYRDKFAKSFPYVVVPEDAAYVSLQETSPMLLLAMLVTTSWRDGARMDALNRLFLKMLSTKLIQNGDRDLDLLNGLLVYLNW